MSHSCHYVPESFSEIEAVTDIEMHIHTGRERKRGQEIDRERERVEASCLELCNTRRYSGPPLTLIAVIKSKLRDYRRRRSVGYSEQRFGRSTVCKALTMKWFTSESLDREPSGAWCGVENLSPTVKIKGSFLLSFALFFSFALLYAFFSLSTRFSSRIINNGPFYFGFRSFFLNISFCVFMRGPFKIFLFRWIFLKRGWFFLFFLNKMILDIMAW